MQPNNLGQPMAPAPAAPVAPAAAPSPMAPAAPAKKSNGMVLGMILLALLAIGGIGFGVWAYMNSNNQPAPQQGGTADCDCEKCEVEDDTDDETTVDPTDYIYVGEWGIKIKKPENWKNVISEWVYNNSYPHAVPSLGIRDRESNYYLNISYYGDQSCEDANIVGQTACINVNGKYYSISSSEVTDSFKAFFEDATNYSEI